MVVDLVDLFFELVYPIFPIFHQPSFVRRIARGEHTSDRSLFAVTSAVCALVSARVRDGAVYNPHWDLSTLQHPPAETLYEAAVKAANELPASNDLNLLRAHAILAIAAIQNGNIKDMHEHLGRYHTLVARGGLHDEDNWPRGIGLVEIEERRRLFWSIYTLDVFTSIVWSGVIRSREFSSNVRHPAEIDDENLNDATDLSTLDRNVVCMMTGRIFVIDLYRTLEHVMMNHPTRSARNRRTLLIHELLQHDLRQSQRAIRTSVTQMYDNLPTCLKEIQAVTCQPTRDRFGFQAADNIATVQLLCMVLLSATGDTVSERCDVVRQVVDAFMAIPSAYHSAISVPLLFHLAIIGQILCTALEKSLSRTEYRSVREVIEALAQLLGLLDGMHMVKGASRRLQEILSSMDSYIDHRRAEYQAPNYGTQVAADNIASSQSGANMQSPHAIMHGRKSSFSSSGSTHDSLGPTPLNFPQELLDDFSQVFDFTQVVNDWPYM